MKRLAIGGLSALGLILSATTVLADPPGHARGNGHGRGHDSCERGDCRFVPPGHRGYNPGHGRNDERHGGRHAQWGGDRGGDTYVTINIGSDGSRGERWVYRDGYGIRPAPYGQEYRVINGQLVLVSSETLQVVAIIGLLSALIQ